MSRIGKNHPPRVRWSRKAGHWEAIWKEVVKTARVRLVRHGRGNGVTDMGLFDALDALRNARPEIRRSGFTLHESA